MIRGGLSYGEEQGLKARDALELASEVHQVVQLPCCGTSVEVRDPRADQYVVCPNPTCRKRHVIISNLGGNYQIRSEQKEQFSGRRLIY